MSTGEMLMITYILGVKKRLWVGNMFNDKTEVTFCLWKNRYCLNAA